MVPAVKSTPPSINSRRELSNPRRLVIKLGSAVLSSGEGIRAHRVSRIASEIAEQWRAGRRIVVVSSGAIAVGLKGLGLKSRPQELVGLQAAASVGQVELMRHWSRAFARQGLTVAQVLLTHDDVADRRRYLNARHTLLNLLQRGVVPIVNENDSVSTEEIRLGDNDHLAALCTGLIGAELLLLFTDVDGVFDADPRRRPATRPKVLSTLLPQALSKLDLAAARAGALGTGGIRTKILAAREASELGAHTLILNGARRGLIRRALTGEQVGSWMPPRSSGLKGRKGWLAHASATKGVLKIDSGAVLALRRGGKSLLPSGVVAVEGEFSEGSPVAIQSESGERIAVGLSVYDAKSLRLIAGQHTNKIQEVLGFRILDEAVHRDDLVLVEAP